MCSDDIESEWKLDNWNWSSDWKFPIWRVEDHVCYQSVHFIFRCNLFFYVSCRQKGNDHSIVLKFIYFSNFQNVILWIFQNVFDLEQYLIEECMRKNGISEQQYEKIINAYQPDEANDCFFGCLMFKSQIVRFTQKFTWTNQNYLHWFKLYVDRLMRMASWTTQLKP